LPAPAKIVYFNAAAPNRNMAAPVSKLRMMIDVNLIV
jgi:hypothetical protein